jgi:predicted DNA-binding protein YlxM (UPF0122 family)
MTDSKQQLDFDRHSVEEFKKRFLRDLPALERILVTIHEFCYQKGSSEVELPCHSCPSEENCNGKCEKLKKYQGGDYKGRGARESLSGFNIDTLVVIEKIRRTDVFKQFEPYKDKFKKKTWEAIFLYFQEGLSEQEIAKKVGVGRSAISNRLKRAKDKKEQFDKDLRGEAYEQLRKQKNDDV